MATPPIVPGRGLIRFGAQNPGHPWWILADTLCEALIGFREPLLPGVRCAVHTPADLQGALWNPVEVGTGALTVGITTPSVTARLALEGKGPYRVAYPELRAIANYPHEDFLVFTVRAATGIGSLAELAQRRLPLRVVTGRRGDGAEDVLTLAVDEVLRQYGAGYEAIERWGGQVIYGGPTHVGGRLLLEGKADALFQEAKHAHVWRQIAEAEPMNFLALDGAVIEHMERTYGFRRAVVPAGIYRGVERDLPTVDFSGWLLFCRSDLPDEWAYALARACDRTRDQVGDALRLRVPHNADALTLPIEAGGLFRDLPIPLHPGAAAYAREQGLIG